MKFIRDNFVPVALGFLNGGGGNSIGAQMPSGEKIPGEIWEAVKKYAAASPEERRKVTLPNIDPPRLPAGGLAVRIYMRPLLASSDGGPAVITGKDIKQNPQNFPKWWFDKSEKRFPANLYAEPMGDLLWLTQGEVRAIVPENVQAGQTFPMADPVAKRILRMHLKNGTQGWLGWWAKEHIRSENLTLRVDRVSPVIAMTLEGAVLLANHADPAQATMGYDARLSGRLEFDPAKKVFTRFDLLALGDQWGPPGESARPGRNPMGVSFEIARGDHPMDLAYPFALYAPGKEHYFKAESFK